MAQPQTAWLALADKIDRLNEWIGRGVAWLTLLMVLITFAVVVLRYVFSLGWIAMQESVTYLHTLVFMLGAAYTLKRDGHVRVDIFYRGFGPKGQAAVDLFGAVFLLLPVSVFIAWISLDYVFASWKILEDSRETAGLPGVFLLKTVILLMAALLFLQGIAQVIRSASVLSGAQPPAHGETHGTV
ncbi:MAG: TRAP transporter small permease subunit [Chromatiales bacterium]|nr:TRAP transporter small permease subunit [Chromatiales bacterium]